MQQDNLNSAFGRKLKELRTRRGLSQMQLAEKLGCSHQMIQKQEAGIARIGADMIYQCSVVLSVEPSIFFHDIKQLGPFDQALPSVGDVITQQSKAQWRIVIAEDSPEDEVLFRRVFDLLASDLDKEFIITSCSNGIDMLEQLRRDQAKGVLPDLIFVDLNMPKKGGIELLKDLKKDRGLNFVPVIVLTHSANAYEMLRCYQFHASGYICKPFDLYEFRNKMASVVTYWADTVSTAQNY